MQTPAVDYSDVQGLVRYGYSSLNEACLLLLTIRDVNAARSWLTEAPISNAIQLAQAPDTALQIAFTADGLRALQLPLSVLAGFSDEFLAGMTDPNRSRRLGDVAENSPANWHWGGPNTVPHAVLMLYAKKGQLETWTARVQGPNFAAAFDILRALPTSDLDNTEPFGFADGISQPQTDFDRQRKIKDNGNGNELEYGNLVALGEFLLGYPNEYDRYTDRPLLPQSELASSILSAAEDAPDKLDLGKNGTYLVLRTLSQDVRSFWQFVDKAANQDPQARKKLAEAMVGRSMDGHPLVPLSQQSIAGIDAAGASLNQFTYDSDPNGTRCPFGAHIRRANPRNADLPPGSSGLLKHILHIFGFSITGFRNDVMASTRFHRILRRGREYGPPMTVDEALASTEPDTAERGIQFICLSANICRQFEFVQGSWLMSTKFNALTEESDPLLGNRQPVRGCPFTDTFSVPQETGLRRRITGLPQFIRVRGGAYFFLPSLRAIQYLSQLK